MSKHVIIMGGFSHEGLSSNVEALGFKLMQLNLNNVLPRTWLKRASVLEELNESQSVAATVIYLHTTLLLDASKTKYRTAFSEILKQATMSKTIVFIFQDNLDNVFSIRHAQTRKPKSLQQLKDERHAYNSSLHENDYSIMRLEKAIERLEDFESRKLEVESFIASIYESGAEVAPFYVRSDVTIRLQEFLDDIEQGTFLRLFVPNDRFQAKQLNTLLSVLERYLRQVEGQQFSIDERKSNKGIIYIFRSNSGIKNIQNLNEAFSRFDSFMMMCGDNPKQANEILKSQGIISQDSEFMIEQYTRDYKRLILDTKHEFEKKSLLLKHQFEADALEHGGHPRISWKNESVSSLVSTAATGGTVIINTGNMSISNSNKVHTEVEKIINGSTVYNDNDKLLIELFSKYAEKLESLQCRSDLDQLKDQTVAEPSRKNAKQRLVGFLLKTCKKAGGVAEKVAVEALKQYLDSLMNGGA